MKLSSLAALALTLVAGSAAQAQNLVANGSFETPDVGGSFTTYSAGSLALTGWTINGGSVDLINSYWNAAAGTQSLDLNGSAPGTISQVLGTQVGSTYTLSFALAGNPDGAFDKALRVYWGGALVGGTSIVFDQAGTRSSMAWTTVQFTGLTATSAATELRFQGLNTGNGAIGAALDDVAVVTATPEPATYALMATGLLAIAGVARRRRA